jgi:hypothetical protein
MSTAHNLRVAPDPDDQDPDTLAAPKSGPEPADPTEDDSESADWRAETIATQWEPENQLLGALMWLPAKRVGAILEVVPDSAIWRPMNRWVYVMYSRTVFDSPTRSVLETLWWRWSGLAANLRNNAVSGSLIGEAPR